MQVVTFHQWHTARLVHQRTEYWNFRLRFSSCYWVDNRFDFRRSLGLPREEREGTRDYFPNNGFETAGNQAKMDVCVTQGFCTNLTLCRLSMIVRVNVVLNRTVVDSDWRFENQSGSHLQSQSELYQLMVLNSGYRFEALRVISIKFLPLTCNAL